MPERKTWASMTPYERESIAISMLGIPESILSETDHGTRAAYEVLTPTESESHDV